MVTRFRQVLTKGMDGDSKYWLRPQPHGVLKVSTMEGGVNSHSFSNPRGGVHGNSFSHQGNFDEGMDGDQNIGCGHNPWGS